MNLMSHPLELAIVEYSDSPKEQAAELIAACRAIVDAAQHRPVGAVPTPALLRNLRASLLQLDLNPHVR